MPVQIQVESEFSNRINIYIATPGEIKYLEDFSRDKLNLVGFLCKPEDDGLVVFRFGENQFRQDSDGLVTIHSEEDTKDAIVADQGEDSIFHAEVIHHQGVRLNVAARHLGGLSMYYIPSMS